MLKISMYSKTPGSSRDPGFGCVARLEGSDVGFFRHSDTEIEES
jgi:hypothetical protein